MVLFGAVAPAMAQTVFRVRQGVTGRSTFTSNAIIEGNGTGALAPSSVSIDASNNITGANNLTSGPDTHTIRPALARITSRTGRMTTFRSRAPWLTVPPLMTAAAAINYLASTPFLTSSRCRRTLIGNAQARTNCYQG